MRVADDATTSPEQFTLVSHALCPYVQRAAIALEEKGVAYERIEIDLAHKPAWFLALNPLGKTPVLIVKRRSERGVVEQPLFESAVICDYLDETLAPRLHPRGAFERAQHRAWVEVASATLNTIGQLYSAPDERAFDQARAALARRFEQLEQELQKHAGPWFGGPAFSLVDAAFAPVFRYFEVFERFTDLQLFAATPRVRAWRAALALRPSVIAAASAGYPGGLMRFLRKKESWMGELARGHALAAA